MRKKVGILGMSALAITLLSVAIFALSNQNQPAKHAPVVSDSTVSTTAPTLQTTATTPETASAVSTQNTITSQSNPTASTPSPNSQPAALYGADSSNPGSYIVFDHASVMNSAGVAADQQTAADTLITKRSNWTYKIDGQSTNLCLIPDVKMATAGADYKDNPVTQLSYCNSYVMNRYGSWAAALNIFDRNLSF